MHIIQDVHENKLAIILLPCRSMAQVRMPKSGMRRHIHIMEETLQPEEGTSNSNHGLIYSWMDLLCLGRQISIAKLQSMRWVFEQGTVIYNQSSSYSGIF